MKKLFIPAFFSLILTACGSNPISYIPSGKQPIVNLEAPLDQQLAVSAKSEQLEISNLTETSLKAAYKLFWYNEEGVTQSVDGINDSLPWQTFALMPKQRLQLPLKRPTAESHNYRFYLRQVR